MSLLSVPNKCPSSIITSLIHDKISSLLLKSALAFSGVATITDDSSIILSSSLLNKLPPYRCETETSRLLKISSNEFSIS